MAKKVVKVVKLQIPAGKANPAPPVGPALGQACVNIMGFCKEFNARTADQAGLIIPVEISVYEDRSFTFITKTPPAAVLLKNLMSLGFLPQPAEYKAQQEHEDGCPDDGRENSKAGEARSPCAKKSVPNPSADQPGNHRAENSSRQPVSYNGAPN